MTFIDTHTHTQFSINRHFIKNEVLRQVVETVFETLTEHKAVALTTDMTSVIVHTELTDHEMDWKFIHYIYECATII